VEALEMGAGALRIKGAAFDWLLLFDLEGGHSGSLADEWICKARRAEGWQVVLSTTATEFGGSGQCAYIAATNEVHFGQPELILLRS
jgi:maltooligosyltrehalose trehalohydrolase